jgi:ribosomal protein S15P/S13E
LPKDEVIKMINPFLEFLRQKHDVRGAYLFGPYASGFRPERLARVSGEYRSMENLQAHFQDKRDDLFSRYRLAQTPEDRQRVIRNMRRFSMEASP